MLSSTLYKDFRYEDLLPAQLQILSVTVNQVVSKELQNRHALSLNEWRVLSHIAVNPGTTAQSIASTSSIDKGWISRSLQTLVEKGWITKTRSTTDSRKTLLELTAEGLGRFEAAASDVRALQNRLLDAFSADDHEAFIRLSARLQRAAQDLMDAKNT